MDSTECAAQGCTWAPAACLGTAPLCNEFSTEYSCTFTGCTWRPEGQNNGGAGGASSTGGSPGADARSDAAFDGLADLSVGADVAGSGGTDGSPSRETATADTQRDAAVDGPAPAIHSFTGAMVRRGGTPQLCWDVVGATTLTIDHGVGSVLGQTCVYVLATESTTYTLTLNGTITAQATVWALDDLFQPVADMHSARQGHTATLLPDGRVLIAGGYGYNVVFVSVAELYDPATGKFTSTGTMTSHRAQHTATSLADGRVLLAGGVNEVSLNASAEIFDPSASKFTAVGDMTVGRCDHAASLLPDGRVLMAGSGTPPPQASSGLSNRGSDSAEVFDPATGTFTAAGKMSITRRFPTATALSNGTVLVAGGSIDPSPVPNAEVYEPSTGTFRVVGAMAFSQSSHSATLLSSGTVLLAGGASTGGDGNRAELYAPTTEAFTETGRLAIARGKHNATRLPNGKVLLTGSGAGTAEIYDPDAGTFAAISYMISSAYSRTATLLLDGSVLITGGVASGGTIGKAELYLP